MESGSRFAVVLLNFGGPRSRDEVRRFLFEILRDPNTIQLPAPGWVQDRLAAAIARRRAVEVGRQYGEIGGRSPIVAATERIAAALAEALQPRAAAAGSESVPDPLPVYIAHRYLPGDTARAAARMVADGITDLLALPLYPHYSHATSGSSFQQLAAELSQAGYAGRCRALRSYPDSGGYLAALAERLEECLADARLQPDGTVILCSAHGLPATYIERGDPYKLELYRSLEALKRRFAGWRFELSFQSRVGPAEWLQPYTDRILSTFAAQGVRQLVFLPLSFVNDHIETLYEIGHTYFELARRSGLTPHRVRAIEDHPAFIGFLAQAVRDWQAGLAGVPLHEVQPPDQSFARSGFWLWSLWLSALVLALGLALAA